MQPIEQLQQANRLMASMLRLEKRLRDADSAAAIRFIAVNDTLSLVRYELAFIGSTRSGVDLMSGTSELDLNAPFIGWGKKLLRALTGFKDASCLTQEDLPKSIQTEWKDWLPEHLAVIPLETGSGYYLLLARQQPFSGKELSLLSDWGGMLGYHFKLRLKPGLRVTLPKPVEWLVSPMVLITILVGASLYIPVTLSVLAPSEIVPRNPIVIRAPLDAVVAEVLVNPDQFVNAGDLLIRFDDRSIKNQQRIAMRSIATARAAYRQSAQQALTDTLEKSRLVLLQADIEKAELELDRLRQLIERTEIYSPASGQFLMTNRQEWIGRPVSLGERLAMVAEPSDIEVKGWLSPSDQVSLEPGSTLTLFDNSRPDAELQGSLISIGYQVEERPEGGFAFPVRASLDAEQQLPPIGSRGTLRLESEDVSLAYLILRRPLALLRQWLGI